MRETGLPRERDVSTPQRTKEKRHYFGGRSGLRKRRRSCPAVTCGPEGGKQKITAKRRGVS